MRPAGWVAVLACLLALGACGAAAQRLPDVENGRRIYFGEVPVIGERGEVMACVRCHPVERAKRAEVLGNNLYDIGNVAATRVPGQSAAEYLRQAIVDPDSYLVEGFQEGVMYTGYRAALTAAQIDDLVAYMLTLKAPLP